MNIMDIIWHDGQLLSCIQEIEVQPSTLKIHLNVYPNNQASKREMVVVECTGVERCAIVLDYLELLDNRNAGNIGQGYIKRINRKEILRIFLMDGYIDITCKSISIQE